MTKVPETLEGEITPWFLNSSKCLAKSPADSERAS